MSGNFDSLLFTSVAVGTAETEIAHSLGRVPLDGFVLNRNAGARVWRGSTAWTSSAIYLQASASVQIVLMII